MVAERELHRIAELAAHEAVKETFELLGVDVSTEAGRREFREAVAWASQMRRISDKTTFGITLFILCSIVSGVLLAIWAGIKVLITKF